MHELLTTSQYTFNEEQWLKILFIISDTQIWLNELIKEVFFQLPLEDKRKLFRKTYYLTAPVLAHIIERHYYKIQRYPNAGKFTVPVVEIISYLRDSFHCPTVALEGSLCVKRIIDAGKIIGFDQNGQQTSTVTIISDSGGRIITAFPGHTRR